MSVDSGQPQAEHRGAARRRHGRGVAQVAPRWSRVALEDCWRIAGGCERPAPPCGHAGSADGLSAKRARTAHQVLSQVLASVVDGGRLPRNVAEGTKLPKVQRREMHFLGAPQVEALYGHLFPDELEALAGRLEDARGEALRALARTQHGPAVVPLREGAGH
jgi:hypothetical protein